MKKPFYVTIRKKKDGRQRVCIVFNNTTTGERGKVVSASSLFKAYYKGQVERLLEMPTGGHWSSKLINTLSLWALSTGFVSFDRTKGPEITFKEYATKFWTYDDSDYVARKNSEKEGSIHRSYVKDMLCVLNKHIFHKICQDCSDHEAEINLNRINSFHSSIDEFNRRYRGVKSKYVNRYAALFSVSWNLKRMRSDRDMLYKTVFNYAREYSEVIRNTELSERNIYTPEDILWRAG